MPTSSRGLAALLACVVATTGIAQDAPANQGGFRGFLKHTADAVMGQPNRGAAASVPGTVSNGNAATDGAAYRPISPASGGTFPDIFRGYTTVNNTGRFPRVSIYFETFGASEACWRTRATIWTSETNHREETFDLCNAALVMKDDLGHSSVQADPTTSLLAPMSRETFAPGIPVTPERTAGPNPPRLPFLLSMSSAPNAALLRGQYQHIVARAMVISGFANNPHIPLFWVAGFNPIDRCQPWAVTRSTRPPPSPYPSARTATA
jgi:hypothetical protein